MSSLRPPPPLCDVLSLLTEKESGRFDACKLLSTLSKSDNSAIKSALQRLFKQDLDSAQNVVARLLRLLCVDEAKRDLDEGARRRLLQLVSQVVLKVVALNRETNKRSLSSLSASLCAHVDAFPQCVVTNLMLKVKEMFLDDKMGKLSALFFDVMAKLLDAVVLFEKIEDDLNAEDSMDCDVVMELGKEVMSGAVYRSKWLQVVCSERWHTAHVVPFCSLCRDLNLSSSDVDHVVNKAIGMISKMECEEVPPLMHQVLMLTRTNGNTCMAGALVELDRYFDQPLMTEESKRGDSNENDRVTLLQARSTVIHYLSEAVKLGHPLHKDLQKLLRVSQQAPDLLLQRPFKVLLLLSAIWRQNKRSFVDQFRVVILKSLHLANQRSSSIWYRCVCSHNMDVVVINDLFKGLINETSGNQGRKFGAFHLIEEGVVALGLALLDYGDSKENVTKVDKLATDCHKIGSSLLTSVVSSSMTTARGSLPVVIKSLTSQIVQSKGSPQYTDALRLLTKAATADLYENSQLLEDLIDQLTSLSVIGAKRTLSALLPLLQYGSVANSLVLVLRKALFSRDSKVKLIGISGVLRLLKTLKIKSMLPTTQLSQGSTLSLAVEDIHRGRGPSHESLCSELLGVLRRGLGQQMMTMRLVIYRGLPEVVSRNPELCQGAFDLIFQHGVDSKWISLTNQTSSNNDVIGSETALIDVDRLISEESAVSSSNPGAAIVDPVGWYLLCMNELLVLSKRLYPSINGTFEDEDQDEDLKEFSTRRQTLNAFLSSLAHKYSTLDLIDLGIEKDSDYSSKGTKNNLKVLSLNSIYEALMDHTVCDGATEVVSKADVLQSLFKLHHDLGEVLKTSSSGAKKARNTTKKNDCSQMETQSDSDATTNATNKHKLANKKGEKRTPKSTTSTLPQHCLSFRTVVGLVELIAETSNDYENDSVVSSLKSNTSLVLYLLDVLHSKLIEIDRVLLNDTQDSSYRDLLKKQLMAASKALTSLSLKSKVTSTTTSAIIVQAIKSLLVACQTYVHFFENERQDFFGHIIGGNPEDCDDEVNAICKLVDLIFIQISYVHDYCNDNENQGARNEEPFLSYIGKALELTRFLLTFVASNHPESVLVLSKVEKGVSCLKNWTLTQHKSVLSPFLNIFLDVALAKKGERNLLLELCQAIHINIGDIDESMQPKESSKLPFVTLSTAEVVFKQVNKVIEQNLTLIELSTSRAKQLVSATELKLASVNEDIDQIAEELCIYTATLAKPLIELSQTNLSLNLLIDVLLKNISKVYAVCSTITKFFASRLKSSKYCLQTSAFSKFVALIGAKLTAFTYKLISHIEQIMEVDANVSQRNPEMVKLAKHRVQKEARVIPNVIFRIEQFENDLISLSKKAKLDFMQNVKRPVARDFKFKIDEINKMLGEGQSKEQQEQSNDDGRGGDSDDDKSSTKEDNENDDDHNISSSPLPNEHDAESTRVDQQRGGNENADNNFDTQASSIVAGNVDGGQTKAKRMRVKMNFSKRH